MSRKENVKVEGKELVEGPEAFDNFERLTRRVLSAPKPPPPKTPKRRSAKRVRPK